MIERHKLATCRANALEYLHKYGHDEAGAFADVVVTMIDAYVNQCDEVESMRADAAQKREALAEYAHMAWSQWMRHQFARMGTGNCLSASDSIRWRRQMRTPYAELPESEKASDRAEADKIIALLQETKQ